MNKNKVTIHDRTGINQSARRRSRHLLRKNTQSRYKLYTSQNVNLQRLGASLSCNFMDQIKSPFPIGEEAFITLVLKVIRT